jgi:hypothetical protein
MSDGKNVEENDSGLTKVLITLALPGRTEENDEEYMRIVSDSVKIQTEHLLNTDVEYYHNTNPAQCVHYHNMMVSCKTGG